MINDSNYLLYLIRYFFEQKNVAAGKIFANTDLSLEKIKSANSIKQFNYKKIKQLLENCLAFAKEEGFGLYFGSLLDICAHGPVGKLIMTSRTLEEAMINGAKYAKVVSSLLEINFAYEDENVILVANTPLKGRSEIFLIESFFSSIQKMISMCVVSHAVPLEIRLSYPPTSYAPLYSTYFSKTLFAQNHSELVINKAFLSLPLHFANEFSNQLALEECKSLFMQQSKQCDLLVLIPSLISQDPKQYGNLTKLAACIGMSPRTLHRKLTAQNTSFSEILANTRIHLAKYYLLRTQLSIAEISDRLGFSDPSNFTNSFKKILNQAPSVYRQMHA